MNILSGDRTFKFDNFIRGNKFDILTDFQTKTVD